MMKITLEKQEDDKWKVSYGEGIIHLAFFDLDEDAAVNLIWTVINADKLGILKMTEKISRIAEKEGA